MNITVKRADIDTVLHLVDTWCSEVRLSQAEADAIAALRSAPEAQTPDEWIDEDGDEWTRGPNVGSVEVDGTLCERRNGVWYFSTGDEWLVVAWQQWPERACAALWPDNQ